jgi:hypothetical protein
MRLAQTCDSSKSSQEVIIDERLNHTNPEMITTMELRSRFPGMNPYLEHPDIWHDFHETMLPALRNEIVNILPESYTCKLEEQVYVHELPESSPQLIGRSDVAVIDKPGVAVRGGSVANEILGPVQVELVQPVDVERLTYLEIRDRRSPGKDREQYLGKRSQLLQSSVHLVEIDLLRRWPRMPADNLPKCDYCVLVSQAERRPIAQCWPFRLTDPMPPLFVPLRETDAPLRIELQPLFQQVFVAAGYARHIYELPLDPPLNSEQAIWAESLLSGHAN